MSLDFKPEPADRIHTHVEGQLPLLDVPPADPAAPDNSRFPRRELIEHAVTVEPVRAGWRASLVDNPKVGATATTPVEAVRKLCGHALPVETLHSMTGAQACSACGYGNALHGLSPRGSQTFVWYCENPRHHR